MHFKIKYFPLPYKVACEIYTTYRMAALTAIQCAIRAGVTLIAWLYLLQTRNNVLFSEEQLLRCNNETTVSQCIFDIYNHEGAITKYHYSIGKHTPLVDVQAQRVCQDSTDILGCLITYRYGFGYYAGIYTQYGCGIITDILGSENDTKIIYFARADSENQTWVHYEIKVENDDELVALYGNEFYIADIIDAIPDDIVSTSEKSNDGAATSVIRDLVIALISIIGTGSIAIVAKYVIIYCKTKREAKPVYPPAA